MRKRFDLVRVDFITIVDTIEKNVTKERSAAV